MLHKPTNGALFHKLFSNPSSTTQPNVTPHCVIILILMLIILAIYGLTLLLSQRVIRLINGYLCLIRVIKDCDAEEWGQQLEDMNEDGANVEIRY